MNPSYFFIILPVLSLIVGTIVGVVGYRKWRAKGALLGVAVFCVLSVVLVPTVIPAIVLSAVTDPSAIAARESMAKGMNEAYLGATTILKRLPTVENSEQILSRTAGTSNSETGCYHAWVDILYGTSLDASTISSVFAQQLRIAGWQGNAVKLGHSRDLVQGENAQFIIEYGGDYADYWKQQGYEKEYLSAITKYANVLNARIDYFVPSRVKCTQ